MTRDIMSNLYRILGFAFAILFSIIQVGHCCITFKYTVTASKTVLDITCQIPSFTGTGSWFIDGVGPATSCSANLGCTTTSSGNYTFDSDSNGMNVKIDPFSSFEIGKLWKCEHPPSFSCNDTVPDPPESDVTTEGSTEGTTSTATQSNTTQRPTKQQCVFPCGKRDNIIIIVVCGFVVVAIIIGAGVYYYKRKRST